MIGKGSYGSVFLATLKKPKTNFSHLPTVMAVKSAEVSASGSLQKEKEGEMIFNLLLEYASGGSLSDLIKKSVNRGLPESDVKRYTRSILRGLAHIHECGYVHCDLKPDNILLVPVSSKNSFKGFNYMAKIADFGLSKAVKQNKRGRWDIGLRGTPVYMAPETVLENIQGPQSDVWALGCVVFEMLTGKSIWG
ncbi:Mitogen-activated protein kinase kinase [Quillaja saponaria]|uniref:Mitogen-activated protein kinase kinase n=1 Tax=Quillaja saponaria TaxID=32244 RepID=A0AAD7Q3X9_QUISA|nr:Mitogen-activated protein kinase kinase [Quillaja saponaria]